jgi:3-oxoacyl-[acyl-carrier-protein] synthase II
MLEDHPLISGLGMISCLADSAQAGFDRMCAGFRDASPLIVIDPAAFGLQRGYQIIDAPQSEHAGCDPRLRASAWLIGSIAQAIHDAGLVHARKLPVIVGTGLREFQSFERWCAGTAQQPLQAADLHFQAAIQASVPQAGEVITLCNACSASNFALGLALDLMHVEGHPVVIAAGCDAIAASMHAFTDRAGQPGLTRVEPFERKRRGVILGEGAAAVVLENRAHLRARAGQPKAQLRAVGMACDASHETAPERAGIAAALDNALALSGSAPSDIDLIVAHGTGTALNDPAEAWAIASVLGAHRPKVTAIKGHTGHTSGAAGLMGVVTAILAMQTGCVPPISERIDAIEEAAGLDLVSGTARVYRPQRALVNAFGFGGVNAVAVIETIQGQS